MTSKGKTPAAQSGAKTDAKADTKPGIDAAAVRELAKLLKETGLTEIEIEHNGARIRVSRGAVAAPAAVSVPVAAVSVPAAAAPVSAPTGPAAGAVPSPMVGTVFLSPEPGKPAFIAVGHTVKEGDTLFIVEAMKTMNAITAPRGGKVVEINVADGSPVEFGQTLCVIA
jgi:acetyl-CoA carboxylase biotin carboxyl carrier protein